MAGQAKWVRAGKPTSAGTESRHVSIIHDPSSFINPRGFTLIELLVVISVVALLMALLLPCLQRVRKQAGAVRCQAHLRQSGVYFAAYAAENDGRLTMGSKTSESTLHLILMRYIPVLAGPSLEHKDLLLCPMASKPKSMPDPAKIQVEGPTGAVGSEGARHAAWMAAYRPSQGDLVVYIGSFGFNQVVYSTPREASDGGMRYLPMDMRQAWQTPVYLDCIQAVVFPTTSDEGPPAAEGCISGNCNGFSAAAINRHDGGVNCLFMDWSVRKVGLKELWTLKWMRDWNTANRWTKAGGVQPEDWPEWMRNFKDY